MTPAEQIAYFEEVAKSNRAINHQPGDSKNKRFFRMDLEELESDLRTKVLGLSLVLEHSIAQEEDQDSDNAYIRLDCAFWILHPTQPSDSFEKKNEHRDLCYRVAWQVYTKLKNDKKKGIFKGYEPGSFNATAYTSLAGTALGYRCSFIYKQPAPVQLNETEWFNETLAE